MVSGGCGGPGGRDGLGVVGLQQQQDLELLGRVVELRRLPIRSATTFASL